MKIRRLLSLLLVLSLLAVAGCGAQPSTQSAEASVSAASASEDTPSVPELPEASDIDSIIDSSVDSALTENTTYGSLDTDTTIPKITDEPVTLSMFITFPTEYLNYTGGYPENVAYQTMGEKTGVNIDFYQVPSGDSGTEYSLLIAGGDYTDFIGGSQTDYENEITIELSDLIYQYMPNYNAVLKSNPVYERAATTDANEHVGIFGFYTEGYAVPYGPVIRQDWLDELGLDTPVTYDDYHTVLTAFKNNYNCSSPLFLANSGVPVGDYLTAGYGIAGFSNPNTTQVPFYQVDGVVEYGPIQDGYYEYLKMIQQWYNEGLIDKDFATTGNFMFPADDQIANDQVGIFYSFVARISAFSDINEDPDFNIQPIADAVQKEGDKNHLRHINSLTAGSIGISSQCDTPEIAAQYMDAWFTHEGYMLANYGIENETYTIDANGDVQFTDLILNNPDGLSFDMCLYKYCQYNQGVFLNNWERQILSYTDAQKASIEIWNTSDYEYGFSSDITMTAEETEEFTAAYSDIKTFVAENTLNFILGGQPLDDEHWDAYVSSVKEMGIDHCIEIKQQSVTRYLERG